MIRLPLNRRPAVFVVGLVTSTLVRSAVAGPPLICHPIEIGTAKSLPWGGSGGFDVEKKYDLKQLTADTLSLLAPETDVLVRMETLRRATLYAEKNRTVALELLSALQARVMDAEAAGQPDGMAWFDAGYLAQCYAQLGISTGWKGSEPIGYDWATKGSEIRGSDASMEFALALMTVYARSSDQKWAKHADHEGHLRKAIAGAADGTLLARNLVQHFGESGKGLEHLRARYAGR